MPRRTKRQWSAINEMCRAFDLDPAKVSRFEVEANGPALFTVAVKDEHGRQVRVPGSPTDRVTRTVER